jgi:glycosyltransferase involved in cell wall biosynthesis
VNVCLNAQLISDQSNYRGAGVNNYARRLLAALGAVALAGETACRFTAFVHTPQFAPAGVEIAASRLPLERPEARIAWEQTLLPWELTRRRADLVHGLVNVLPLGTRVPGVVTVHDLSFVRTPQMLPPLKRAYLTRLCAASVARARAVIAVSGQTADDVVRCFGAPPAKVHVVHNGVGPEFTPGEPQRIARFRREKGLPAQFVLYLGTLEPRKNLELLLRAFARWRGIAGAPAADVKLVLAGGKGWYYDTIFAQAGALGLADAVLFPGFVPPAELPDWYRAAAAFVYPSLFEGFGLPVLEAMACGAPVICSQVPSLLEVAGNAALAVPPTDEDAWAHALHLLYEQPALAADLSRRGLQQAAQFSWRHSAQRTIQVYNEVALFVRTA